MLIPETRPVPNACVYGRSAMTRDGGWPDHPPGCRSVVTWRRARIVMLSVQGMDVAAIAKVAFTSEDRVRDVTRLVTLGNGRGRMVVASQT